MIVLREAVTGEAASRLAAVDAWLAERGYGPLRSFEPPRDAVAEGVQAWGCAVRGFEPHQEDFEAMVRGLDWPRPDWTVLVVLPEFYPASAAVAA